MCRLSGKATTQDTTPELAGLRKVFKSRGVPTLARPSRRTSHTSTVPFRRPAYIWLPSVDQHACANRDRGVRTAVSGRMALITERHHGGVFSCIQSLPTPFGESMRRSQRRMEPSMEAVMSTSRENDAYADGVNAEGIARCNGVELVPKPPPPKPGPAKVKPFGGSSRARWDWVVDWEGSSISPSASGSSSKSGSYDMSDLASSSRAGLGFDGFSGGIVEGSSVADGECLIDAFLHTNHMA